MNCPGLLSLAISFALKVNVFILLLSFFSSAILCSVGILRDILSGFYKFLRYSGILFLGFVWIFPIENYVEKLFNFFLLSSYCSLQNMTDALRHFIETYYIHPITYDTGYNPVNTVTWALVLVLCVFLTLKLLKKLDVKIDHRFIAAVSPYIIGGASLRVMEDAELFAPPLSYLLITPLISFLIFFCCLAILILSVRLSRIRNYDYTRVFGLTGVLWSIANLTILLVKETVILPWVLFAVVGIAGVLVSVIYAIAAKFGIHFLLDKLNVAVLAAHLLDASSSYIGIDMLGYSGKHVIEGFIVKYTGTAAGMFPLKLGVLVPILYVLDTQFTGDEEIELKNLVLLTLIVIGLAPAVRNTLRMFLGV